MESKILDVSPGDELACGTRVRVVYGVQQPLLDEVLPRVVYRCGRTKEFPLRSVPMNVWKRWVGRALLAANKSGLASQAAQK